MIKACRLNYYGKTENDRDMTKVFEAGLLAQTGVSARLVIINKGE